MKKLLIPLVALTLFAPSVSAEENAVFTSDVNVTVNGLVCDFCAQALQKVFSKHDEVNSIKVDLDNHLVAIDLKDGANMDDETIKSLILDSGYNVVSIARDI